ncbi:hypothetical protein B1C78_06625 [Thioalkalivibrio denitrificans]|uniref:CAAX prenyl protease 2/Lysostaphin resistance protein A-like domain-containing protein n=1 Tax=Thioalkalivibrio denitrificans TaxID=108003 RepID=A0A1V3NKH1_9GAMM|nr:type II CAAX endopeptidase family protein [Thioalkalivibrio denitrificans]OOG25388.1 hypothetical protein B1C78_06625 [Thioalkalivibrio denitrificans]
MQSEGSSRLPQIRYCLIAILVLWYWAPGRYEFAIMWVDGEWYLFELAAIYYMQGTMALFIILAAYWVRLDPKRILGRGLESKDIAGTLLVVVMTFAAASVLNVLFIIPVTYVLPEFVEWWLDWSLYPLIYVSSDGSIPVWANLLSLVSLVVLAPLIEEMLFRGYLLHRLAQKLGLWAGVLVSSVLFGAVHPDPLAAAVMGFGMAVLYLKTQTLWAPILAHALYNLIVWFWHLHDVLVLGADYYDRYGIEHLREDWWMGAIALVVLVVFVDRLMRRRGPLGPFALPGETRPSGIEHQRS